MGYQHYDITLGSIFFDKIDGVFDKIYNLDYEKFYLAIMGVFHGLTNLGGSLLSAAILSQDLTKDSKRSTIAVSYCSMAVIQIITLIATLRFDIFLNKSYLLYWATAPTVFFIVEKNLLS